MISETAVHAAGLGPGLLSAGTSCPHVAAGLRANRFRPIGDGPIHYWSKDGARTRGSSRPARAGTLHRSDGAPRRAGPPAPAAPRGALARGAPPLARLARGRPARRLRVHPHARRPLLRRPVPGAGRRAPLALLRGCRPRQRGRDPLQRGASRRRARRVARRPRARLPPLVPVRLLPRRRLVHAARDVRQPERRALARGAVPLAQEARAAAPRGRARGRSHAARARGPARALRRPERERGRRAGRALPLLRRRSNGRLAPAPREPGRLRRAPRWARGPALPRGRRALPARAGLLGPLRHVVLDPPRRMWMRRGRGVPGYSR
jgi:hypothetical protein